MTKTLKSPRITKNTKNTIIVHLQNFKIIITFLKIVSPFIFAYLSFSLKSVHIPEQMHFFGLKSVHIPEQMHFFSLKSVHLPEQILFAQILLEAHHVHVLLDIGEIHILCVLM